jgi:hypothetical protein
MGRFAPVRWRVNRIDSACGLGCLIEQSSRQTPRPTANRAAFCGFLLIVLVMVRWESFGYFKGNPANSFKSLQKLLLSGIERRILFLGGCARQKLGSRAIKH